MGIVCAFLFSKTQFTILIYQSDLSCKSLDSTVVNCFFSLFHELLFQNLLKTPFSACKKAKSNTLL